MEPKYKRGNVVGLFRLEQFLGGGGMAEVWRATVQNDQRYPHRNGKQVALKISHVDQENAVHFEALLKEEIDILRNMRHPGIVRVFPVGRFNTEDYLARDSDIFPDSAPWYFAMEPLSQTNLKAIIKRRNMPIQWKVEFLYQLAVTIGYLHARRFAHRDLKPDNILFRIDPKRNEPPLPVLIDFGLAQRQNANNRVDISETKNRAASIAYASPERVKYLLGGSPMGNTTLIEFDYRASEVWSFGVIAYELLSDGQYIFPDFSESSVNRTELVRMIRHHPHTSLPKIVPERLSQLVDVMLEKHPAHRPKIFDILEYLEIAVDMLPPRV